MSSNYEPFDQDKWLAEPWRNDSHAVAMWEQAHGHDVRVKCYAEFGCQVIEPTLERRIEELLRKLEQAEYERDIWKAEALMYKEESHGV